MEKPLAQTLRIKIVRQLIQDFKAWNYVGRLYASVRSWRHSAFGPRPDKAPEGLYTLLTYWNEVNRNQTRDFGNAHEHYNVYFLSGWIWKIVLAVQLHNKPLRMVRHWELVFEGRFIDDWSRAIIAPLNTALGFGSGYCRPDPKLRHSFLWLQWVSMRSCYQKDTGMLDGV